MRSNPIIIILVVGLTLIISLLALPFFYPIQSLDSPQQRWEYMIESVPDLLFADVMNTLGEDGWELIFARRARNALTDSFVYEGIFKRPQVEDREEDEDAGRDGVQN